MRRRASAARIDGAVALFFTAVACAWWWPLPLHITSGQVESPPIDAAFNEWIIGWGVHALTTDPLEYFDANMFYPFDGVLAWGDHLFGVVLFAVPLVPFLGALGAYNLLLVAGSAISGFTAYKLGQELTGERAAGVLAGVLWAFAAGRLLELSHIQILSTQWIPLVFLFAEKLRRRPSRPALLGLTVSAWLVLATNVYLAIYTALSFAVVVAFAAILRRIELRTVVQMAFGWMVATALGFPLYLPSIRWQAESGVRRRLEDQSGASLEALLPLPMPGRGAQAIFGRVHGADYRYATVGIVVCILLVVLAGQLIRRRIRRDDILGWLAPYFAAGLFGIVSAQGPSFRWHGTELAANPVFLAAYYAIPGYDAMRVPARWFLVALLFVALVAASGAASILSGRSLPVKVAAVCAVAAFVTFEQAPSPLFIGDTYTLDDRPAYQWLTDHPGMGPILELPISAALARTDVQVLEGKRMYLSTFHWRPRVNGGISPVIHSRYERNALVLDQLGIDPRAVAMLQRWDVRHILVVREDFRLLGRRDFDAVIARLEAMPELRRVRDFDDAVLYKLRP